MKIKNLIFFACIFQLGSLAAYGKPLLVVLLMVKNENQVIIPTLETYLSSTVTTDDVGYILYDTGSTDGTDTLAEDFFKDNGISQFKIVKEHYDTKTFPFGKARTRALEIARETYPESTFILFPDAEWYFHGFDKLLEFCRDERANYDAGSSTPPPYYSLQIQGPGRKFPTPRLILTKDDVVFVGRVHECPTKCSGSEVPADSGIYIELGISRFGYEKSAKRWLSDREVLLEDLLEDPKNPRTALYLGLTELWLRNDQGAYTYLKLRTELHSFPEEDYFAWYNLGLATMNLCGKQPELYHWDEALKYFLKAASMRPQRAEPLVRIAKHYLDEDNHALAYIFAKRATELAVPTTEKLTLDLDLYDYQRWEILSRAAWYLQEYEVGEAAAQKAIEARPNITQLYRNLSYYWERKK